MSDLNKLYFDVSNEQIDSAIVKNSSAEDFYEIQQKQQEEKHQQELEKLKQEVKRMEENTYERKSLSYWVRCVIPSWLSFTAISFILNGFNIIKISESVMITLLGTTTANVLGLGYILLKGLFPDEKQKNNN